MIIDYNYHYHKIYCNYTFNVKKKGSMAYVESEFEDNQPAKFINIRQIDTGNMSGMKHGGLVMA